MPHFSTSFRGGAEILVIMASWVSSSSFDLSSHARTRHVPVLVHGGKVCTLHHGSIC